MKASPRQQALLLDLQDLDTRIARLRRKRKTIPERDALAGLSEETQRIRTAYMTAQRELDAQTAEIQRVESDVKMVRDRRARDEQLMAASTSSKEAVALQGELDTLTRRTAELEDRQLELMEAQEAAQAVFDAAASELAQIDGRRAELTSAIKQAEQEIDRDLANLERDRAGTDAEIQRDLIGVYNDLRARIGIGAARLRGNVSEASNMEIAPAALSGIRSAPADELVYCPDTGAILVRGQDADE